MAKKDQGPTAKAKLQKMKLADLVPHPKQSLVYTPTTSEEDEQLANDLRQYGQRDPIVVMPPNNAAGLPPFTVLDGHRRGDALKAIGQTVATVLVRHDLKDADTKTVTDIFLNFNMLRRQLHVIDRARVLREMIMNDRGRGYFRQDDVPALRDRLGELLGMGGRNADRYIRLLGAPLAVQTAVRDGLLPLVVGARVGLMLSRFDGERLEQELHGVTDKAQVRAIVKKYIHMPAPGHHRLPEDGVAALAGRLATCCEDLAERLDDLEPQMVIPHVQTLSRGRDLLDRLIAMAG